jgi:hypothetical protein
MNKIYTVPSGFKIDLSKVVAVGVLRNNEFYDLYIPVYVTGSEQPIKLVYGNTLENVEESDKAQIKKNVSEFIKAWEEIANGK